MEASFTCPHCSQTVSVYLDGTDQAECPNCQGAFSTKRQTPPPELPPQPAVQPGPPSNLSNCRDCGKEISKRAKSCPHCGAPIRRTSVLAWGFGGILLLLIAVAISAVFKVTTRELQVAEGREERVRRAPPIDKQAADAALARLALKYDKMLDVTFYSPRTKRKAGEDYLEAYISKSDQFAILRFKLVHRTEDWLFPEKLIVKIGEDRFTVPLTGRKSKIFDSDDLMEWFDLPVEPSGHRILSLMAAANVPVDLRLQGDTRVSDRRLTSQEQADLKDVLLALDGMDPQARFN